LDVRRAEGFLFGNLPQGRTRPEGLLHLINLQHFVTVVVNDFDGYLSRRRRIKGPAYSRIQGLDFDAFVKSGLPIIR